jgi:hypothetical protein
MLASVTRVVTNFLSAQTILLLPRSLHCIALQTRGLSVPSTTLTTPSHPLISSLCLWTLNVSGPRVVGCSSSGHHSSTCFQSRHFRFCCYSTKSSLIPLRHIVTGAQNLSIQFISGSVRSLSLIGLKQSIQVFLCVQKQPLPRGVNVTKGRPDVYFIRYIKAARRYTAL